MLFKKRDQGLSNNYKMIIIIGAARSGTKILRDVLAQNPIIDKVPYDINYIWRIGNEVIRHDELTPEQVTEVIEKKIMNQIDRYHMGGLYLVEKSVSNSLRIPFVSKIYPSAKILHIIRDGFDVIESSYRQWLALPSWDYLIKKAIYFPYRENYRYLWSYSIPIIRRALMPKRKINKTWGPQYCGIFEDLKKKELIEVCAIQWMRSVEKALTDFNNIPNDKYRTIRYEDLVMDPKLYFQEIYKFLELNPDDIYGIERINDNFIGKGLLNLNSHQINIIEPYIVRVKETIEKIRSHQAIL